VDERIKVTVRGVFRLFPPEKIRVVKHLNDGGANVEVKIRTMLLRGEITGEEKTKLMAQVLNPEFKFSEFLKRL
jgi:hypothetical protein